MAKARINPLITVLVINDPGLLSGTGSKPKLVLPAVYVASIVRSSFTSVATSQRRPFKAGRICGNEILRPVPGQIAIARVEIRWGKGEICLHPFCSEPGIT